MNRQGAPVAPGHAGSGLGSRLAGLGLLLACILVYWHAIGADFIGFDDTVYASRNPNILRGLNWVDLQWAFTSLRESNWHPLTWISLQLDAQLYGLFAPGYHLTNIILHAGNALLFFLLLLESTGKFWPSILAAALWGLHPLHVESVAWVSERKDVLSTLFWLLTMLAHCRFARKGGAWRYAVVAAFFILGGMAKPMLVTLPLALLLWDFWPLGRWSGAAPGASAAGVRGLPRPAWPLWREKLPLLLLSAGLAWVTLVAQRWSMTPLMSLSVGDRVANSLVAYVKYLGQTVLPAGLCPFYPHPGSGLPAWQAPAAAALLLAISWLALRRWRTAPYLAVGWLWYLGTLVPVIGLVQVGAQAMADRYVYVPHLGLFTAVAFGLADAARRWRAPRAATWTAALVLLAALAGLTFRQAGYWVDNKTLFTHAARVTERNYLAHLALSFEALKAKDWPTYQREYSLAVSYSPSYVCGFHNTSGFFLARQGLYQAALVDFVQALELCPNERQALTNLGVVYGYMGRYVDAINTLERTLELYPGFASAQENLDQVREEWARVRAKLHAGGEAPPAGRGNGTEQKP